MECYSINTVMGNARDLLKCHAQYCKLFLFCQYCVVSKKGPFTFCTMSVAEHIKLLNFDIGSFLAYQLPI